MGRHDAPAAATAGDLEVRSLTKRYGDETALGGVSLEARQGEFLTLLGPSGSGKTTTLRIIAGLENADEGSVRIDGVDVTDLAPHQRNLGVVFQSYALFPHMSVLQNVAYGLRRRGADRSAARERAGTALEVVGLSSFGGRRPSQLSGGQQQRVALARAIAFEPPILLMDEPLSALDRRLRDEMQLEIRRIHREVGSTIVFVTHDQEEALTLSDRIAVFNEGIVEQVGTSEEMYRQPCSRFVSRFLGDSLQFTGPAMASGAGTVVRYGDGIELRHHGPAEGSAGTISLRPEQVRLIPDAGTSGSGTNQVPGVVTEIVYAGAARRVVVELPDGQKAVIRLPADCPLGFEAGSRVLVTWPVEQGALLWR